MKSISKLIEVFSLLKKKQRKEALWLVAITAVGMMFEMLGIGAVIPVVAIIMEENIAGSYPLLIPVLNILGNPTHLELIKTSLVGLVAVYAVRSLFLAFLSYKQSAFAFKIQEDISARLFKKYLNSPYVFHTQRNSSDLTNNIIVETTAYTVYSLLPILLLISELFVLTGTSVFLFIIEPLGAITVVSGLGLSGGIFYKMIKNRIGDWGSKRVFNDSLRLKVAQQAFDGIKETILAEKQHYFYKQYVTFSGNSAHFNMLKTFVQQTPRLWIEFLAVLGLAILIFLMTIQAKTTDQMLAVMGVFAAAAFRLIPSVNRILGAVSSLKYGRKSFEILRNELQEKIDIHASRETNLSSDFVFSHKLKIDDVVFRHLNKSKPTLDGVSLEITKGSSIGFVGESGSGKTTLIDLLMGLYEPNSGHLLADQVDIYKNMSAWRKNIGYVPQTIFLMDDTLRRNIAFGITDHEIDDQRVRKVLDLAQLSSLVESFKDGINEEVGEKGVRLSGGQRQRIGIARALYHNPEILILDEATSALDEETEMQIMSEVNRLKGEKTLLIIAHRVSTLKNCDFVYRLGEGKILNSGKPESVFV